MLQGCPLAGISSLRSDIPHRLRRVVLIKRKRALKANFRALFLFISGERGMHNYILHYIVLSLQSFNYQMIVNWTFCNILHCFAEKWVDFWVD
jgi:hypothetical protein